MKSLITFFFLCGSLLLVDAQFTQVEDLTRPDADWEARYQDRLELMYNSRIPTYSVDPNRGGLDDGKYEWPEFLAKLAWPSTNSSPSQMQSLINLGRQMVNGVSVGTFNSPFSTAGYSMYFFMWKDSIAKYDPDQIDLIYEDVNAMWAPLMRVDHLFDPCCGYNDNGGKEFNSENFHWMLRTTGFLFANELHGKTVADEVVDNHNRSINLLVRTGLASPRTASVNPTGVSYLNYFNGYVNNLTRALYSSGRIEWNSNNYWGHTMNPLITLYEGADRCGHPEGEAMKKKAKACLDWMMLEAALHYQDGFQAAADARAKTYSFGPFKGSVYQYTYPFFVDDDFHPTYSSSIWNTKSPGSQEVGYVVSTTYRPATIIQDIAQRKFPLPVEIQSAKPFYHTDFGTYLGADNQIVGESPYHHWAGNADESRRFEFETIWIDSNITMSSAAVGRPDGTIGTYSEQCMWRLAVTGQTYGARMLSGNAGTRSYSSGRDADEQIGQFRNIMVRAIKKSLSNKIWIAIPDSLDQIALSGSSSYWDVHQYRWEGHRLFLDMGHGVYLAFIPYNASSVSKDDAYSEASYHTKIEWYFPDGELGVLVTEVGKQSMHGSFSGFVDAYSSIDILENETDVVSYIGVSGHSIKFEYTGNKAFEMTPYTHDTRAIPDGGNYPKIWGDGQYIDYQSWDSYRTVYGVQVVSQKWGGAEMTLGTDVESVKISVDKTTAEVTYYESDDPLEVAEHAYDSDSDAQASFVVYPNPAQDVVYVRANQEKEIDQVLVYDALGNQVQFEQGSGTEAVVDLKKLTKGVYCLRVIDKQQNAATYKLVKE